MSEWRKITCEEREELFKRLDTSLAVVSSLTDLDGQYGDPKVFTEWGDRETEAPVLRDHRYPQRSGERPDARPCEHYAFAEEGEQT